MIIFKEWGYFMEYEYKRGNVYWAEMPNADCSKSLQMGTRPVLVVSNDTNNKFSKNIICLPFSSKTYKTGPRYPFHVLIKNLLKRDSVVLAEQIVVLPKEALIGAPIAVVSAEDMNRVNDAIKLQFGLTN